MMEKSGNRRILVVDDDPSFRELLTAFLDDRGYEVESSADGEEALELLRSETADLVLLDLELPGISGLDVLRAIKSEEIDTKVITISGHEAAPEYLGPGGIKLGAELFLTKPIDLEHLEMVVAAELSSAVRPNTRILIADDDLPTRELLKEFLEEKGYLVLTAADGEAALESVRNDNPQLMLLDLYMPKLSGIEVLERIREEGLDVGVITISGTQDEDAARATFALGATDFITKPLDLEYLELSLLTKLFSLGT